MKSTSSILTIVLLGSCAWWFTSCASEQVNGPLPPVTSLKSDPALASDTNELVPAGATAPIAQPLAPSRAVQTNPAASAYLAVPVVSASAPMAVDVQPVFQWSGEYLLSLSLWLLALLVLAAALRNRARYQRENEMASPETEFAPIGLLENEPSPAAGLTKDAPAPSSPYLLLATNHPRPNLNPQKEIIVTAFFNGQERQMHFSPATTIKKVAAWAVYQFEIPEEKQKDAYLAIHGYSVPLIDTAHLGRFVMRNKTNLELDVKTITRVSV
jgi:hypothetical protein